MYEKMKRLAIFSLMSLLLPICVHAQDLIVTQEGNSFKAYNLDIGTSFVYYQFSDSTDSPLQKMDKSNILIIKKQDGTKIVLDNQQDEDGSSSNQGVVKSVLPPVESGVSPEIIANLQIGSLIEFNDDTKGIVFYLDGEGHGLAVYLYEKKGIKGEAPFQWQIAKHWYDCEDIKGIPNEHNRDFAMGLGSVYCDAAQMEIGMNNLPAINWCRNVGPDWYLPSVEELMMLLDVANQGKGKSGMISKAIKANGGDAFKTTSGAYLSCSEVDNTDVYAVFPLGANILQVNKYDYYYCRAIRMF